VRIQKDSTSQEILDEAETSGLSPAAQRLRELYLKARYDDDSKVSREDVQEAQRCLQQIREEEHLKT
jgi:HEPN domain.